MKAYEFGFEGRWLGGHAVVLAETEEEARDMILPEVQKIFIQPVAPEDITLKSFHELSSSRVIYFDNGDY